MLGDDFTVRGGSADATIAMKPMLAERMANELRLPIIRIIEGSGGGGSVKTIETTGRANLPGQLGISQMHYQFIADNLGTVPVVALGLGLGGRPRRGAPGGQPLLDHDQEHRPPCSWRDRRWWPRIGQNLSKQELGGWEVQCRAGARRPRGRHRGGSVRNARAASCRTCPRRSTACRRGRERTDPADRREEKLFSVIPRDRRKVYKMRQIIDAVVDKGSFFEMGQMFGRPIITGLARLDGLPVAILASDPYHYGGAWTADACAKIGALRRHGRDVPSARGLPVRLPRLPDRPGGREDGHHPARRARHGRHQPVERAVVHGDRAQRVRRRRRRARAAGRLAIRYAWLSGWWGSLPLEGGIEAAYRAEIDAAPDRKAKLAEIETRLNALRSPFRTAETFWVEEIIDPRDTRKLLCEFANLAEPLRTPGPRAFPMRP